MFRKAGSRAHGIMTSISENNPDDRYDIELPWAIPKPVVMKWGRFLITVYTGPIRLVAKTKNVS
jgi:hypothetical protein